MTGKQLIEQEGLRAATAIMIRALILAAIVALVVSAAPVTSAGTPKKPPSQKFIDIGTAERLDVKARVTVRGIVTNNNDPEEMGR